MAKIIKLKVKQAWKPSYLNELAKMSRKQRIMLFVRIVIFNITAAGFLYQLSTLLSIYWSGTTIVDNRVEHLRKAKIPALTICLPTFIDMNMFANNYLKVSKNQTERAIYKEYLDFKSNFNGSWTNESMDEQERLFNLMAHQVFIYGHIPLAMVFNNLSAGALKFDIVSADALDEHGQLIDLPRPSPLLSLVTFIDPRLCFTLYSIFDIGYTDQMFNILDLEILFTHDNNTFPLRMYEKGDFHVALHSPVDLPRYMRQESFKSLKMGMINVISYTSTHIFRLPAPYDTNCKTYSSGDSWFEMRNDCKQNCIYKRLYPELKCLSTKDNYYLTRKDNHLMTYYCCDHNSLNNYTYKKYLLKKQLILETECDKECLHNCHDVSYEFECDVIKVHSWVNESNQFAIRVEHNRIPDQIIKHKPIMSFIEMMSNFGGLLGMWLGVSITFILQSIVGFFIKNN